MPKCYIGDFVRIGNNRWRVYHESGHADIVTASADNTTEYRYYVRDYLGSTRAVLAEDGSLLQDANYYPGGLSFSQLNDSEETDRLHSGKEWVDLEGLAWYDNAARFHDPILCRFTTPDPLAEKYPALSPYSHCANNPLTIIDPDGREIVYSETISDDERIKLNNSINRMHESPLFSTIYKNLEASPNTYTINVGLTHIGAEGDYVYGMFSAHSAGGGTLTFLPDKIGTSQLMAEEFYHAYQNANPYPSDANTNLEFEAKTFSLGVCYEMNAPKAEMRGITIFGEIIEIGGFGDDCNAFTPCNLDVLNTAYLKFGEDFTNTYKDYPNEMYKVPVKFLPQRFENLIKNYNN